MSVGTAGRRSAVLLSAHHAVARYPFCVGSHLLSTIAGRKKRGMTAAWAYYALRAIAALYPSQQMEHVNLEREWQAGQLSTHLRAETMDRIVVEQTPKGLRITIRKGADF